MFFERHVFNDRALPLYFQHQTRNDREPLYEYHWHETPEFIYVTDGCVEIRINGRVEHYDAGTLVFINPQFSHCFRAVGSQCSYYCLIPDNGFLLAGGISPAELRITTRIRDSEIEAIFLSVVQELKEKQPRYQPLVKAKILEMLALLLRRYRQEDGKGEETDDNAMRIAKDAINYMESHFAEKIGGEEVAAALNISRSYLCHMIRKATKQTLTENLLCIRCRKAREMLWEGIPVSEVVWRTGFGSASHFSRTYRRMMGIPPSSQRRKNTPEQK